MLYYKYISDSSILYPHETFFVHVTFNYIQENWRRRFPLETTLEVIFYPPCSVKKNCKKPNISFTLIFLLPEFTDWIKIKLFRNMLHNAIFPIWVNVVSKVMDMYVKGLFQTQLCSTMHYDPLNYRIKYTTKSILHKLSFSSYFMLVYVNVNNRTWGYFAFKSRDSDYRSLSLLK